MILHSVGSSQHMGTAASQVMSDSPHQPDTSALSPDTGSSSSPFMSPTFAAIQTLTSFMPSLPWSSPKIDSPTSLISSSPRTSTIVSSPNEGDFGAFVSSSITPPSASRFSKSRGYVPREKQLAKLKLRLEQEERSKSVGFTNGTSPSRRRYHGDVLDL